MEAEKHERHQAPAGPHDSIELERHEDECPHEGLISVKLLQLFVFHQNRFHLKCKEEVRNPSAFVHDACRALLSTSFSMCMTANSIRNVM